jgi:hypothetical protein
VHRKATPRTLLRQQKKRPCGRRYKFEKDQQIDSGLEFVTALILEKRSKGWVNHLAVKNDLSRTARDNKFREIFHCLQDVVRDRVPVDLIKVACCAALGIGPRVRRYRRKSEHNLREPGLIADLKRTNPNMTDKDCWDALRENPNIGLWATHVTSTSRAVRLLGDSTSKVCVSKVFPEISRAMASYYRCKYRDLFAELVGMIRDLATKLDGNGN